MTNETFSIKLKKILNSKNIKPAELARLTGFSESLISQYLNNRTKPKNDRILIISKVLDVSPTYLMGWTEEELLATPEDKEKVGQVNENINDEILKLEPFNNLIDAIYFIKKYDVKLSEGIDFNKMTGDSILALINTILTTTQETIKKERGKKL